MMVRNPKNKSKKTICSNCGHHINRHHAPGITGKRPCSLDAREIDSQFGCFCMDFERPGDWEDLIDKVKR